MQQLALQRENTNDKIDPPDRPLPYDPLKTPLTNPTLPSSQHSLNPFLLGRFINLLSRLAYHLLPFSTPKVHVSSINILSATISNLSVSNLAVKRSINKEDKKTYQLQLYVEVVSEQSVKEKKRKEDKGNPGDEGCPCLRLPI